MRSGVRVPGSGFRGARSRVPVSRGASSRVLELAGIFVNFKFKKICCPFRALGILGSLLTQSVALGCQSLPFQGVNNWKTPDYAPKGQYIPAQWQRLGLPCVKNENARRCLISAQLLRYFRYSGSVTYFNERISKDTKKPTISQWCDPKSWLGLLINILFSVKSFCHALRKKALLSFDKFQSCTLSGTAYFYIINTLS